MTSELPIPATALSQMHFKWPDCHVWAIDQMPCPAYFCDATGAIVHCNAAAVRIWGAAPADDETARWDGFAVLRDLDGAFIPKDESLCAIAALGEAPLPAEQFASCWDGQSRRIVMHAKPILDADKAVLGVLCCLTDISEKRRLETRARDSAAARQEFLSMLAHELRNPLAPIMSIASFLQRPTADPSTAKLGGVVQRQTKQLARFITDLLDASRMACAHELPVELRACTEDEVIALALEAVEPDIRARRQRLVVDAPDVAAALRCDPERVAQALGNVLSNASAFTPDGEEFLLRVSVDGSALRLEVVDSGPGIGPEDLEHVFEPFERRAMAPNRAPVGAGLGLTIAKGVCEAHGGSINVRSAGLGHGTTVSLTLPVAASQA